MWSDIKKKQANVAKRYVASQRHTIEVDPVPFMDEVAELVGCKPNIGNSHGGNARVTAPGQVVLQCMELPV